MTPFLENNRCLSEPRWEMEKGHDSSSWQIPWMPWSESYRWLWAFLCGLWEPNSGPLLEQQGLLITEPSLYPVLHCVFLAKFWWSKFKDYHRCTYSKQTSPKNLIINRDSLEKKNIKWFKDICSQALDWALGVLLRKGEGIILSQGEIKVMMEEPKAQLI